MKKAVIRSTESYLPERILSNADLEKMVETSDEWISSRVGIKERRIAAEGETSSDMAVSAAKKAIKAANIAPEEVDLILCATLTPDFTFPATACLIQRKLGLTEIPAFDLQAACTGYVYGLSIAKAFIESGVYKTILLIATEKLSSIVDYKDRSTCVLFGDGAAASIIQAGGSGLEIERVVLGADGEQAQLLIQPAGGSSMPASQKTVEEGLHYIKMEGNSVFKHAVRRMESASKQCLDELGMKEEEITYFVPHQANERIIDAIAKRFGVESERVYKTIHKYGNTSASAIAIALAELCNERVVNKGEVVLLAAFGAGLTWGASILKQV